MNNGDKRGGLSDLCRMGGVQPALFSRKTGDSSLKTEESARWRGKQWLPCNIYKILHCEVSACFTFVKRQACVRYFGRLSSFEMSLVIQRVQPSGKRQCLQRDGMKRWKATSTIRNGEGGWNCHCRCKTDCTVLHVLLPSHVPPVSDSFAAEDARRWDLQNMKQKLPPPLLKWIISFWCFSAHTLGSYTILSIHSNSHSHKSRLLASTENIVHKEPGSIPWVLTECLFPHVASASVTLLGAFFFGYSVFFECKSPWVLNMFCWWLIPF